MVDGWAGLMVKEDGTQIFACPKPMCYYRVVLGPSVTQDHKCPHIGPSTYGWSTTMGLVEQIWEKLDKVVDDIKSKPNELVEWEKAQASAYASVLVLFMKPLFSTEQEISREALNRWKARQAGDMDYETPGIRHAKYKTMNDGEVWYLTKDGWTDDPRQTEGAPALSDDAILNRAHGIIAVALERKPLRVGGALPLKSMEEVKASKPVTHSLPESDVKAIRFAHGSGMFSPADLAKTYKVSESVITSIVAG